MDKPQDTEAAETAQIEDSPAVDLPRLVRPSWFRTVMHRNLGECMLNMECLAMQFRNADPTSIFVEHDGDIKEVSRSMVSETNTSTMASKAKEEQS